jgi:activator of 2-hydroxyglutaryl-CoA dehydratase
LLLIDAGTSYIKTCDTVTGKTSVLHITEFGKQDLSNAGCTTGHNAALLSKGYFINELVALAEGAKSLCKETDFTILDIGSRDMKLVTFKSGRFDKCDWNTSCGAMVGFTIELIMRYFNKTPADLRVTDRYFDITCGLLGITKFFDQISKDSSIEDGMSSLINGMARFSWQFAGKPKVLYLSGGLAENMVFVESLKKLVPDLRPLGRFVLIEGLKRYNDERATDSTARNK